MAQDKPYVIHACIIGKERVGKTALRHALCKLPFDYEKEYQQTIGVDVSHTSLSHNESQFKFFLWDLTGEERFNQITHKFYPKKKLFILCYDPTDKKTLEALQPLLELAKRASPKAQFILVSTKADLEERHEVTDEDIERFKADNDIDSAPLVKTCAKGHETNPATSGIKQLKHAIGQSAFIYKELTEKDELGPDRQMTKHQGISSNFLLKVASAGCGLTGAGLIIATVALTITLSTLWPLGLAAGGTALLLGAGFFAYKAYKASPQAEQGHCEHSCSSS